MKTPKSLNMREMWKVYRLLGNSKGEKFLLDEIISTMEKSNPQSVKESLGIMYKDMSLNPLEIALMFAKGLTHNKFFEFQLFIKALHGSS